jgi:hypothetical protein
MIRTLRKILYFKTNNGDKSYNQAFLKHLNMRKKYLSWAIKNKMSTLKTVYLKKEIKLKHNYKF